MGTELNSASLISTTVGKNRSPPYTTPDAVNGAEVTASCVGNTCSHARASGAPARPAREDPFPAARPAAQSMRVGRVRAGTAGCTAGATTCTPGACPAIRIAMLSSARKSSLVMIPCGRLFATVDMLQI